MLQAVLLDPLSRISLTFHCWDLLLSSQQFGVALCLCACVLCCVVLCCVVCSASPAAVCVAEQTTVDLAARSLSGNQSSFVSSLWVRG